ncbi:MAG: transporter substrate-binding protein [Planctomycetia bacterium]|nr:transporter substrate-binding protein [Planctomycetia bacterium]
MSTDPRISQLLARMESMRNAGQAVTVEELCADCPELADELRNHVGGATAPAGSLHETLADSSVVATSSIEAAGAALPPGAAIPPGADRPAPPRGYPAITGYEILGELGRGGMGVVYKARQTGLNRLVAIKMIIAGAHAGPRARARFYAEAEAVARLQHPNIVQIYEINERDGCPYFSLEFVEGQSLYARTGGRPVEANEAATLVEVLALAIQYAHVRGVVHRDLKPANILLDHGRDVPLAACTPKITDFGLAKQLEEDSRLTQTGVVLGTPCYMAPEQVENPTGEVRPAVDIYGLGALLYELLSGRPPFLAETNFETMRQVVTEDPVPPSRLQSSVPDALERICLKCLRKAAEDRYESAQVLADDLALFLEGKRPTIAGARLSGLRRRASPSGARSGRQTWRGPLARHWPAVAAAPLVLLLAGLGIWGVAHLAADRQHRLDEEAEAAALAAAPIFTGPPIKVGILHSLSGTMAISESAVVDATRLAIDELNEKGGLLGRKIEAIVADGRSDPATFAREAERLIKKEHVCTVFGCWTSASRRTVRPIFETNNHLLIYPVQSEGLETSANIVYVGAAPNQQIIPAVKWSVAFLERWHFFLVGSDYVFPRAANEIIKDEVKRLEGEVMGEAYLPLGSTEVADVIRQIKESGADVILNTINGDSNVAFFRGLRAAGIQPADIPVVSFSIGEQELRSMKIEDVVGDYAAQNYFQTIDRPENEVFLKKLHDRYGAQRVATDAMVGAYVGVHLWAQAVLAASSDDVVKIRENIGDQTYRGPSGVVRVDPRLLNTHRTMRIGQIRPDGQFDILVGSETPVAPEPYPKTRTREEWDAFLDGLYKKWGNRWEAPAAH